VAASVSKWLRGRWLLCSCERQRAEGFCSCERQQAEEFCSCERERADDPVAASVSERQTSPTRLRSRLHSFETGLSRGRRREADLKILHQEREPAVVIPGARLNGALGGIEVDDRHPGGSRKPGVSTDTLACTAGADQSSAPRTLILRSRRQMLRVTNDRRASTGRSAALDSVKVACFATPHRQVCLRVHSSPDQPWSKCKEIDATGSGFGVWG